MTKGTGRFARATGSLTFEGAANIATGAFTDAVEGRICVRVASEKR